MNPSFKPFSDKRVRQAINYAIDTDLIINKLVKGKAYRATSWLPLTSPVYDKTMKPYAFDPPRRRQLLAEAGYPNGFEFEWTTQPERKLGPADRRGRDPDAGQGRHQGEGQAGRDRGAGGVVRKGEFQAYVCSQATGPDPQAALECFHSATPQSACNYTTFKNADFDKLIDEAGQTDDPAKRASCCGRPTCSLYDEAPVWFFNYNKAVMAVQPWIHGRAGERNRADPPERRRHLGRRYLAREVTLWPSLHHR